MTAKPSTVRNQSKSAETLRKLHVPGDPLVLYNIWDPGSAKAAEKAGAKATIIDGPLIKDGVKYWHVKFDDGVVGWVPESALNYLTTAQKPLSTVKDAVVGGKVLVSNGPTPVFADPGTSQIGLENVGAGGTITGGPTTKDGVKYWKIRFSDGLEGWVAEDNLDYFATTATPLSQMPSILGATVIAKDGGAVILDSPGGKAVGQVKAGARGKIIEGPIIKDGVKYWHIKFDDGQDGWVSEDSLDYVVSSQPGILSKTVGFISRLIYYLKYMIFLLCIFLMGWFIFLARKLSGVRRAEALALTVEESKPGEAKNQQWESIVSHVDSANESEWRLAILEADIILGGVLDKLGLPGDSIGDKLKAVDKSDFLTIDNAWEAHKVRNQIAHDGSLFALSQHEAKRVIELYHSVFREFKVV